MMTPTMIFSNVSLKVYPVRWVVNVCCCWKWGVSTFSSVLTFPKIKISRKWIQIGCKTVWDRWSLQAFPKCDSLEQFRWRSEKVFQIYIQDSTYHFRDFDGEYRHIYKDDLVKIYDRTKCRKPCSYMKYSLVGEEQPSPIDNGHLLFSLTAMQDYTEVSTIQPKSRSCEKLLLQKDNFQVEKELLIYPLSSLVHF